MGVKSKIQGMLTKAEMDQVEKEYQDETEHLRVVQEKISEDVRIMVVAVIKESGLSQNQLRKRLGISSTTMTELVNGKGNPTLATLAKVAAVSGKELKVSLE